LLLVTFLLSFTTAHAEPINVFNRSVPDYNAASFIGDPNKNSCRASLISQFQSVGCTRAVARGYPEIEYLKCVDGKNHENLSDYYIVYENNFLSSFNGNTPSETQDSSQQQCSDSNYTVFAWNIQP